MKISTDTLLNYLEELDEIDVDFDVEARVLKIVLGDGPNLFDDPAWDN